MPAGQTEESWFASEVEAGLVRRYGTVPAGVRARVDYENAVIVRMGLPGYFLVVADLIGWARAQGIRVGPGRGSAAGSVAAYALGITDIDPLQHGLLFERFLNLERPTMPDVDIDFDDRRRGEVIDYVTRRYGSDRVAQIATFGTIKAKAAVKDATRVLGHPYPVGERLNAAMPPAVMGKDMPLAEIFDPASARYGEAQEFRALCAQDPVSREVVQTARGLEGIKRQWGVHAAGVIMSSQPLIDHIPIMRREQDGAVITQFDYPTCEALGLLKMDFLGLRNLTIIDDALANIAAGGGRPPDLTALSATLDDRATYELLARGDTLGVFQLDGDAMRSLLRLMRPDNFEDISAVLALYRPGPMGAGSHTAYALRKNGQQEITPIHPELAEPLAQILGPTYGLIVYQEQVMAIAQRAAGYTLGRADLLRWAMGKKKRSILDKEFENFTSGMVDNGFSLDAVAALWEVLIPFSDYAFNKAHSASYALISYYTAYLKANHPAEYLAAVLTSVGDDKDKTALYLRECRRMGITVLPPDINVSGPGFTVVDGAIRFGLAAIRNVGDAPVAAIVEGRPYASFDDYAARVAPAGRNRRVVESLVKAGAFDSFGRPRRALAAAQEPQTTAAAGKRRTGAGLAALFDDPPPAAPVGERPAEQEWDRVTLLGHERDALGLYVSGHPLDGHARALAAVVDCDLATLTSPNGRPDGAQVVVGGLVAGLARRVTRKGGQPWAIATLEDLTGSVEVLLFSQAWQALAGRVEEGSVLVVKGRVNHRDGQVSVIGDDLGRVPAPVAPTAPVVLTVPALRLPVVVGALRRTLLAHPGDTGIQARLTGPAGVTVMAIGLRVDPTPALFGDVRALLGPNSASWGV